jgi:hypothetical protein
MQRASLARGGGGGWLRPAHFLFSVCSPRASAATPRLSRRVSRDLEGHGRAHATKFHEIPPADAAAYRTFELGPGAAALRLVAGRERGDEALEDGQSGRRYGADDTIGRPQNGPSTPRTIKVLVVLKPLVMLRPPLNDAEGKEYAGGVGTRRGSPPRAIPRDYGTMGGWGNEGRNRPGRRFLTLGRSCSPATKHQPTVAARPGRWRQRAARCAQTRAVGHVRASGVRAPRGTLV